MRALVLALLLTALAAAQTLVPGQAAPDFALPDLHGNRVALSDYRGQVTLLNFWACWCDTWKDEVRKLKELRRDRPELEFEVLFVSVDARGRSQAEPLLLREGVFFPVLIDPRGEVSRRYGITTVPTLAVLDRDQRIRYVHQGYPGNAMLARELAECAGMRVPASGAELREFLLPEERALLDALNRERAQRGLAALRLSCPMTEVGRERIQRMLDGNRLGHFAQGSPRRWLEARGLDFHKVGENLARAESPAQALRQMLESPSHKSNLLHPGYREVGVAVVRAGSGYLFCLLFAQSKASAAERSGRSSPP